MPPQQKDPWAGLPDTGEDPWSQLPDKEEPGLLQQWNESWVNQPLSHKVTGGPLGGSVSGYIDPAAGRKENQWRIPELDIPGIDLPDWMQAYNPSGGSLRSLFGGMAEGATNVLEGFTSPLNLATMGSGVVANRALKTATTLPGLAESAYTTAPQVANVARRATQALSAPVIASGAAKVGEGIRTGDYGGAAFGVAEMAGGTAGTMMPKAPPVRRQPQKPPTVFDMDLPLNEPVRPPSPVPAPAPIETASPEISMTISPETAAAPVLEPGPVEPPRAEFVDPNTGEIRVAGTEQPGDVLLPTGPVEAPGAPIQRPGRRQRNMILTRGGYIERPKTLDEWIKHLAKEESGTFDPDAPGRFIRDEEVPAEQIAPDEPLVGESNLVTRQELDAIPIHQLQTQIRRFERSGDTASVEYLRRRAEEASTTDVDESIRNLHQDINERYDELGGREQLHDWDTDSLREFVMANENNNSQIFILASNYAQGILRERGRSEGLTRRTPDNPEFTPAENESIRSGQTTGLNTEGVPPWNLREMNEMTPSTLRSYINSYMERESPESQAIVRYGNELLDFYGELNTEQQRRGGFEVDREAQSTYDQQREEVFSGFGQGRAGESYESIAQRVEGMTTQEAQDYIQDMSDSLYPDDIDPMIEALNNRTQTDGTRTILNTLLERQRALREQGVRTGPTSPIGPDPSTGDVPWYLPPQQPRGKTLAEVDAAKEQRTPAFERLAKIIGEGTAREFVEGDRELRYSTPPQRPGGRKRVRRDDIISWGRWAKDDLGDWPVKPDKPGIEIETPPNWDPTRLNVIYRDKNGIPIGHLGASHEGIHTFAVNPDLGLGRGNVAFALIKEALDRGINEPHGGVSDLTRNFIDRAKRIIERAKRAARDESGELVISENVINAINKVFDELLNIGKKVKGAVGRFIEDESGSQDLTPFIDRLNSLFEKQRSGSELSPDEMSEARQLAQRVSQEDAPPVITRTPPSMQNPPFETSGDINLPTGPVSAPATGGTIPPPPGISGRTGRGPAQPPGSQYHYGPTRPPTLGPDLPGMPEGRLTSGPGTSHPRFLPQQGATPPVQTGAQPPQLGPTRAPTQGPRRPRQPYVDRNPQVVIDLHDRIRAAFEQQAAPGTGPGDINKLMETYMKVVRENPDVIDQGLVRKILGANKALLTSYDLSAPGRQGRAFMLNSQFWKALPGMVKAWGSKGAADLIKQSIIEHPSGYFQRGVNQSGKPTKSFAEMVGLDLAPAEEMFTNVGTGNRFTKYSGIEKSGRAHTAFLSKLRSDMFVKFMEDSKAAGRNPELDLNLARSYAEFINNATGRGALKIGKWKLNKVTSEINDTFFAARNMSGQIRTWNQVLNPMKYAQYDPVLRKQALKSLFAVAGMGLMVGEAAREFAGAKVNNDPNSSEFRKVRFGDSVIDFFGGYQQFPVAATKFITGTETPASGKYAGREQDLTKGTFKDRWSVAERYFANRLSPAGSFVWAWMNNREFDGKPFEVKRALYERTFPIAMKDMYDLAKEDPSLATLLSPLIITGFAGAQNYSGR